MNNIIKAQNGKTWCDDVNVNIGVPTLLLTENPHFSRTLQQFSMICLEPANV